MIVLALVAFAAAAGFAAGVRYGAATRARALEVARWAGLRLDQYQQAETSGVLKAAALPPERPAGTPSHVTVKEPPSYDGSRDEWWEARS